MDKTIKNWLNCIGWILLFIIAIWAIFALLTAFGCNGCNVPPVPPEPPGVANCDSVIVSWSANPDSEEVFVYRLFIGFESRTYYDSVEVFAPDTSYLFTGLDETITYYFVLRAVDQAGNISGFSEEVTREPCAEYVVPEADTLFADDPRLNPHNAVLVQKTWALNGKALEVAKGEIGMLNFVADSLSTLKIHALDGADDTEYMLINTDIGDTAIYLSTDDDLAHYFTCQYNNYSGPIHIDMIGGIDKHEYFRLSAIVLIK